MKRSTPRNLLPKILLLLALPLCALASGPTHKLHIPSQDLGSALKALGAAADEQVLFADDVVAGLRSAEVRGEFTTDAALSILLKGSGLQVGRTPAGVLLIRRADQGKPGMRLAPTANLQPERALLQLAQTETAQTPASADKKTPPAAGEDSSEVEVISTKIDGMINKGIIPTDPEAPLYYNVIDRGMIERLGITSVEELFRFIPQTTSPATSLQNAPNNLQVTGGTIANISKIGLRGFAQSQTVILVNGRALPRAGTGATSGTDISRIPIAAIERVEIMPASASALYGGGAIGGAVNVILRKDITAEDLTAYYGTAADGGATEYRLTYLDGRSFRNGNTRLTMTFDYQHRDPLYQNQRNYIDRLLERYPPDTPVTVAGRSAYEQFVLPVFSGAPGTIRINSNTGDLGIPGAPGARYASIPLGTTPDQSLTLTPASFTATAGQATQGNRFNRTTIYNPVDNYTFEGQLEHQITDNLRTYADLTVRYMRSSYSYPQSNGVVNLSATDPLNPFRDNPDTGFVGRAVQVYIDPSDVPDPSSLEERTNYRLTLGLAGKLSSKWDWSVDATGDRNQTNSLSDNRVNYFTSLQALTVSSATAQSAAVRRAAYPLLADHSAYPASQADLDNLWHSIRDSKSHIRNFDGLARLSGDLFSLRSGSIQASALAQYTYFYYQGYQTIRTAPGMATLLGVSQVTLPNQASCPGSTPCIPDSSRVTTAGALELVVPVIGHDFHPLKIHGLDFNFAIRNEKADSGGIYNDEINVDSQKTAVTKVAGMKLEFMPSFSLRGSYTQGFYPPDWNEVSQPVEPYFSSGIPDQLRGNTAQTEPFEVVNGGNPDLMPEASKSYNIGLIAKPSFLPGLTFTLDRWETKKKDGIVRAIFVTAIPRAREYANLITRAPPTAQDIANGWEGLITSFDQRTINISLQHTDGYDVGIRYDIEAGAAGNFFFNTNLSYTDEFIEQVTAISPEVDTVGAAGPVQWRGYASLNWGRERFGATLTADYVGKRYTSTTAPSPSIPNGNGIDGPYIPSVTLWDLQTTYEIPYNLQARGMRGLFSGTKWSLGVLNLFNKEPALISNATSFYNTYQDPRQRYIYLSLKKSL